jgi:hypothetical protein
MVRLARHRLWLAAVAIAVLSACSNGRGSVSDPASPPVNEPPPAPPVPPPSPSPPTPPPTDPPTPPPEPEPTSAGLAGYWKGTASEQDSNRTFDAVVLVDAEGNSQWVLTRAGLIEDDGFVVSANVCCESEFDGDGTGKELRDTRVREASIEAQVSGSVLSGELEFHDDDYDFTLNASSEYNTSLSLAALAGVYTRSTGSILGEQVTLTVTIDANGQLNGSYSNGCVFNGNASIPDASHNMVQLQIDLANCGERGTGSNKAWNGAYSGLGVLSGDVFYHSVLGPTWLGPQSVER